MWLDKLEMPVGDLPHAEAKAEVFFGKVADRQRAALPATTYKEK
jgi:hypothetical protein